MEDIFLKFHIFWKFPHLIEGIFSKLRNEDLAKSNEVSRIWNLHLEQERFFQIRMIENQIEKYVLVENGQIAIKHWERFFKTATTETLNELRYAMKFRSYNFFYKNLFPQHVGAMVGNLLLFKRISEIDSDLNPGNDENMGITPLHCAVQNGHIEVCKYIIDNIRDKNPMTAWGWTPFHQAAFSGDSEICEFIIEKIHDKNPNDGSDGWTPLHVAASEGQSQVIKCILERIQNKSPRSRCGWTPLHLAAKSGHLKACKFF